MDGPESEQAASRGAHTADEPSIQRPGPYGQRETVSLFGVKIRFPSIDEILSELEGQFAPEVVELAKEYLAKAEAQLAAERTARGHRSRRAVRRARGAKAITAESVSPDSAIIGHA
jgi:hypothetical protein